MIDVWRGITSQILKKYDIDIQVEETVGPYIKFQLGSHNEMMWFARTIKENFFTIDKRVPVESLEGYTFKIETKYYPDEINGGFNIELIEPPKESDRLNFNKIEIKPQKEEDQFFSKVKYNLSNSILPPSTMFINPKPPGFGEHEAPSVAKVEEIFDVEIDNGDEPLTWENFFKKKGYCVSVRTKKDTNGKFFFHDLFFLSKLEKIKAFKEKSYFLRYKFQSFDGQKRKFQHKGQKRKFKLFREYPDPD